MFYDGKINFSLLLSTVLDNGEKRYGVSIFNVILFIFKPSETSFNYRIPVQCECNCSNVFGAKMRSERYDGIQLLWKRFFVLCSLTQKP